MQQFEKNQYQLVNYGPDQVNKLHTRCRQLIELLQSFVSTTADLAKNKDNRDTEKNADIHCH